MEGGDREEDVQLCSQPPPHGAPTHSPVGGASTWQASFFLSLKFSGLIQLSSLKGFLLFRMNTINGEKIHFLEHTFNVLNERNMQND